MEKPILALVDKDDVAAELVLENNAGFVADFYDEKEIESGLLAIYELWKTNDVLKIDPAKTKKLHRKIQLQNLEHLIDDLLDERV